MNMRRFALASMLWGCLGAHAAPPDGVELAITTTDGRALRLSDFRGRWLVVNYWATWCGACVAGMPVLSRLVEREPRFAALGLTDERTTVETLRTFLDAHPVSYPIASVDRAALPAALPSTAFGIGLRPISYLIAPDGTVAERYLGGIDAETLARRIDARTR